jgi:hypothetical protein
MEASVSSELVERYKTLTAELTRLEQDAEKLRGEREAICEQLLAKDGKGHPYDLGDGMPMVVATTKNRKHYMAPKNKWVKSGRPPKPPKEPKVKVPKAEKAPKEAKPVVRRAIVGGKIVEIPIERKSGVPVSESTPPPAVEIPKPAPVPVVAQPASEPPPAPVVEPKPEPPPQKELDPLEAALAELDIE